MRLWLEYYDQNESFAKVLPKEGTGDRKLKSLDGNDWILFRLDTPAEFEGNSYEHFLLRSRWRGFKVGGREPTSVFSFSLMTWKKLRMNSMCMTFVMQLGAWCGRCNPRSSA